MHSLLFVLNFSYTNTYTNLKAGQRLLLIQNRQFDDITFVLFSLFLASYSLNLQVIKQPCFQFSFFTLWSCLIWILPVLLSLSHLHRFIICQYNLNPSYTFIILSHRCCEWAAFKQKTTRLSMGSLLLSVLFTSRLHACKKVLLQSELVQSCHVYFFALCCSSWSVPGQRCPQPPHGGALILHQQQRSPAGTTRL